MGTISDLLRYKTALELKDPRTNNVLETIWIRIMGDEDVKNAYKYGRVASSELRAKLKDPELIEYKIQILSLEEQDTKDLYDLIVAARVNDFTRESVAVIAREELPKLEDVAVEPDAPNLEEQEKLDAEEKAGEDRFTAAIDKYVNERKEVLEAELKKTKRDKLVEMAKVEIANIAPTQAFLTELEDQKGFRGSFKDKECKIKVFASIEEYRNTASSIKEQILQAYNKLEMGPDEIKN